MKKTVVFPTQDLSQVAKTFVFMRKLEELYPETEINVLGTKENLFPYQVLSERYHCFEIPQEMMTKIGVYKFLYNLNDVFNIETSFDLESSTLTGIMSVTLRPSRRIGWDKKGGTQRLFYNERISQGGQKDEQSYLKFLGVESSNNVEHINIYMKQSENSLSSKANSILQEIKEPLICLYPHQFTEYSEEEGRKLISSFYMELLEELKDFKVLMFYGGEIPREVEDFTSLKIMPPNPKLVREALIGCKYTLTEYEWVSSFMALEGKPSCFISSNTGYMAPIFYKQKPAFLKLAEDGPEYFLNEEGEKKDIMHVSHFVDFITEYLEEEKKEDEDSEEESHSES